jgi:hypothetical protein
MCQVLFIPVKFFFVDIFHLVRLILVVLYLKNDITGTESRYGIY